MKVYFIKYEGDTKVTLTFRAINKAWIEWRMGMAELIRFYRSLASKKATHMPRCVETITTYVDRAEDALAAMKAYNEGTL